jgi:hypothetical protein
MSEMYLSYDDVMELLSLWSAAEWDVQNNVLICVHSKVERDMKCNFNHDSIEYKAILRGTNISFFFYPKCNRVLVSSLCTLYLLLFTC